MQSQLLDLLGKSRIFLDSVEEIEGSVPVFLIFSEVEVDSGENVALGDIPVKSRNKQPCPKEIPREVRSDSIPYLQWNAMASWLFPVVGLKTDEMRPTLRKGGRTWLLS